MRYELTLRFTALKPAPPTGPGRCVRCGCTDVDGCPEGCHWVDDEHMLCSVCLNAIFEEAPAAGYCLERTSDDRGDLLVIPGASRGPSLQRARSTALRMGTSG